MRKLPRTNANARLSLTLSAIGNAERPFGAEAGVGKVSVRFSILPMGATVIAPRHSFIALVQIAKKACVSLSAALPDESQTVLMQRQGDLCLFPPGSIVTNLPYSEGELILYQISRLSLRAFASRRDLRSVDSLNAPSFASDSTMTSLSKAARQLLFNDQGCSGAVAEYFTLSLYSHLFDRYGVKSSDRERFTGGLSPKHKRITCEALGEHFEGSLGMEELAKRCDLSIGHYARAFRQTFGSSFHRHLLEAKVQRAKLLLLNSNAPLREIALQVGYSDQATFTESFSRVASIPPGRYRRRFAQVAKENVSCARSRP